MELLFIAVALVIGLALGALLHYNVVKDEIKSPKRVKQLEEELEEMTNLVKVERKNLSEEKTTSAGFEVTNSSLQERLSDANAKNALLRDSNKALAKKLEVPSLRTISIGNKKAKPNAKTTYLYTFSDTEGHLMILPSELARAKTRAANNPEDVPEEYRNFIAGEFFTQGES